ncbi:hypothetical protein ACFE04_029435 [Oxalis oulophora]
MGAIKTLLLHYQAKLHHQLLSIDPLSHSLNPISTLSVQNPNPNSLTLHTKATNTIIPYVKPTCEKLDIVSPHRKVSNFLMEKLVGIVFGSILIIGCFSIRPSLAALPNFGVKSEETRGIEDDEEERLFENLLRIEPRNVGALIVVLYGRMRRGKSKEAVVYVERLIDIQPEEVEWRLLQALCYEMMGDLDKAKGIFEEVLAKNPLLLRALHGLAMVMHKKQEGGLVFEMLGKALDIARSEEKVTEERNIGLLIAQMHIIQGQLEDGLKKLDELIDENHRDFRPYLCKGIVYSLQNKKQEAEEQFEVYNSLVPDEFPQRGFLDDIVLAAKTKPVEELKKEFEAEFSKRA